MPFRTPPDAPRDLIALIENEVRERIEEAVDYVSLEILVETRRTCGLPAPAADNPRDRQEYEAGARLFLERLRADLVPLLTEQQRCKLEEATARAGDDSVARLVASQVALARELPDYWQRFEHTRVAFTAERLESGGDERPSLFDRLFRR